MVQCTEGQWSNITAAVPTIAPENFSWVLSHIQMWISLTGLRDGNSVILTERPFRTRYRDGVLFAQPMSWLGVASPQHSKRHDRGNYVEDLQRSRKLPPNYRSRSSTHC